MICVGEAKLRSRNLISTLRHSERGIPHGWTYPRSPKMNAPAARFSRSLQETFVAYHEDLLFDDLADFNQNLADWLLFSNTERPHHSLRLHSPVQSLLINHPECQRWWTHTFPCLAANFMLIDFLGTIVEPLALGIAEYHEQLESAGDPTVIFRDSAFEDDVAKTNLAAILEQHGLENLRSI